MQVEVEVRFDDVRLVADEQCHHELHKACASLACRAYDRRMRFHRPGVRTRMGAGARRLKETPHWLVLRRLGKRRSPEDRDYLAIQLRRTLLKRETEPGVGRSEEGRGGKEGRYRWSAC